MKIKGFRRKMKDLKKKKKKRKKKGKDDLPS